MLVPDIDFRRRLNDDRLFRRLFTAFEQGSFDLTVMKHVYVADMMQILSQVSTYSPFIAWVCKMIYHIILVESPREANEFLIEFLGPIKYEGSKSSLDFLDLELLSYQRKAPLIQAFMPYLEAGKLLDDETSRTVKIDFYRNTFLEYIGCGAWKDIVDDLDRTKLPLNLLSYLQVICAFGVKAKLLDEFHRPTKLLGQKQGSGRFWAELFAFDRASSQNIKDYWNEILDHSAQYRFFHTFQSGTRAQYIAGSRWLVNRHRDKIGDNIQRLRVMYDGEKVTKAYLNGYQSEYYNALLRGTSSYTIILLSLEPTDPDLGSHLNLIIIDHQRRRIQKFDPHGEDEDRSKRELIDRFLKGFFYRLQRRFRYHYRNLSRTCPALQEDSFVHRCGYSYVFAQNEGFCATWVFLACDLKLQDPTKSMYEIVEELTPGFQTCRTIKRMYRVFVDIAQEGMSPGITTLKRRR